MPEHCRIAGFDRESIVNGPGIRYTVFFQGCKRACKGCHNRGTWDLDGGREIALEVIKRDIDRDQLATGLTLSGGEPFLQPKAALELAMHAKRRGWTVWCWTGYTIEELIASERKEVLDLLDAIDFLVDGAFVEELKTLDVRWVGSVNQRVIDMKTRRILPFSA